MNKSINYIIITNERLSHKKSVNNKSSSAANIYYYTSGDSSLYCSYTKKKFSNIYGNRTRNETNIMLQLPLEYNGVDNKKYIYDEYER